MSYANFADALGFAHNNGILHRDVKPANVILSDNGHLTLLDFGIAKLQGETATATGMRLGTLAYMAPERLRGEAEDERVDIWSLGVIMYELLSGRRPFDTEDSPALLMRIIEGEIVPLRRLLPTIDWRVEQFVNRCLAPE